MHCPRPFLLTTCLLAAVTGGFSTAVNAQQPGNRVSFSGTLASGYYEYGLAQSDRDAVWRLAVDYANESGFFTGGFVANVGYAFESAFRTPRDLQIGFYAGYQARTDDWRVNAAVYRYRYPGIARDYDYNRLAVSAVYRDRYFVSTSYSNDWLGIGGDGHGFDVGMTQPLGWNLQLGVSVGRMSVKRFLGGSYTHWNAGLSKVLDRIALDLRYHGSTLDRVTLLGSPLDDRWVLSATWSILPR